MPEPGGARGPLALQYFADQLPLFRPGEDKLFPTITTGPQTFSSSGITEILFDEDQKQHFTKADLLQVGIFFCTQFPSLGIFINKKVGN